MEARMASRTSVSLVFDQPSGKIEECAIRLKLEKTTESITVSTRRVHKKCKTEISVRSTCQHCDTQIVEPVKGSTAPKAKKVTRCTNNKCLKDIAGKARERHYCEQEGCCTYLEPSDIEDVYARSDLKDGIGPKSKQKPKYVSFSQEDLDTLDSLRLSYPDEKGGNERLMRVVGKRHSGYSYPWRRVKEVYDVFGDLPADSVFLARLTDRLLNAKEQLIVHYAYKHEETYTGSSEHLGLLHPTEDGQSLVLVILHVHEELKSIPPIKDYKIDTTSLDASIDELIQVLPVVTSGSSELAQASAMRYGVLNAIKQKVQEKEWIIPRQVLTGADYKGVVSRVLMSALSVMTQVRDLVKAEKKAKQKAKRASTKNKSSSKKTSKSSKKTSSKKTAKKKSVKSK